MSRLVVLGAGAIGGGIGGSLAACGVEVGVIARGLHGRAIAQRGLRVARPDGAVTVDVPCWSRPDEVDWRPDDTVLVATKLFDARDAFDALARAAGDVTVIGGQNGVHADGWARERFTRVVSSMVWVPAALGGPGDVRLHGVPVPGAVDLGPGGEAWVPHLRAAGFRSVLRPDIDRWKHGKWTTNLAGTAFAVGHPELAEAAVAEGRAVLRAAGIPFVDAEELEAALGDIGVAPVDGVERASGGSAALARASGRPLETRWLNGALVDLAASRGLSAPVNGRLCALASAG